MKKIVQLSTSHNRGAIGKIMEQVGIKAKHELGVESWVIFGRYNPVSELKCVKMGNRLEVIEHYLENRILDNEGLGSRYMTKKIVRKLQEIQPDIVHLHNIHDHWLNYPILFDYLNSSGIQVVWTFHDCWAFTGHCYHFITKGCDKYKTECHNCIQKGFFLDQSKRNFNLKKKYFLACKNLRITTVSSWLKSATEESFFKDSAIQVIPNGLDINVFRPINEPHNIWSLPLNKHIVMAVANDWYDDKGLSDYYRLAEMLSACYQLVLVGMRPMQIEKLPSYIIGLERTKSQEELVWLYNLASVVISMSKAETFGLTIAEGMACGTPGIVYDNTAQPELISDDTGIVVENGNVGSFLKAIETVCGQDIMEYKSNCRKRAEEYFDKEKCFSRYLDLYNDILNGNK